MKSRYENYQYLYCEIAVSDEILSLHIDDTEKYSDRLSELKELLIKRLYELSNIHLNEKQQLILKLRMQGKTQKEIGSVVKNTKESIGFALNVIERKLKKLTIKDPVCFVILRDINDLTS